MAKPDSTFIHLFFKCGSENNGPRWFTILDALWKSEIRSLWQLASHSGEVFPQAAAGGWLWPLLCCMALCRSQEPELSYEMAA